MKYIAHQIFAREQLFLTQMWLKESLKDGSGKAAIIRSDVEYDDKENCFFILQKFLMGFILEQL